MKRGIKSRSVKHCVHLSREMVKNVEGHEHCVLISLRDPGTEPPTLRSKFCDSLELQFHDLNETAMHILAQHDAYAESKWVYPNAEHAKAIADFIRRHWDRHVIVHCEAGVSRSAAVCEVLVRLGWGYKSYTSFGRGMANPLLVRLLLREFPELLPVSA